MVVARLIRTVAGIVAAIIVAAILLKIFSANPHNTIVNDVHDAGAWLAGPFKHIFSVGSVKGSMAVNWGLAAVVYLAVAHALAAMIMRAPGRDYRRVRPVV